MYTSQLTQLDEFIIYPTVGGVVGFRRRQHRLAALFQGRDQPGLYIFRPVEIRNRLGASDESCTQVTPKGEVTTPARSLEISPTCVLRGQVEWYATLRDAA